MTDKLVLYGFDGSTYVRTIKMILANKGANLEQVQVNVLEGEPKQPEHLARNPFGKVPVIDHGDLRLYETSAISEYLDEVLPGQSHVPYSPKDRARMRMAMGIIDSNGYGALISVAGYHLFPDFIGGANEEARMDGIARSKLVLTELMKIRGRDKFISGDSPSIADCYLAPICFYVSLTDDAAKVFDVEGFDDWWQAVQALPAYQSTEPDLG